MRRIDLEELRTSIAVQLAVAPRHVLRDVANGNATYSDPARSQLVDHLIESIFAGLFIAAPDRVDRPGDSHLSSRGKFGVTEPWPDGGSD